MNQFESLCKLASDEGWCWKLGCTTCWGAHFRYAFLELAAGKSPLDKNWIIHRRITKYSKLLGPFPKSFTEEQKVTILKICNDADISSIASSCRFPDGSVILDWFSILCILSQKHTRHYLQVGQPN